MVCRTRAQKMLASSVAQRVEVYDPGDQRIQQTSAQDSRQRVDLDRTYGDFKTHGKSLSADNYGLQVEVHDKPAVSHALESYEDHKSQGKRLYKHTWEVYQALLGGSIAWKEAADAVAAFTPYPPSYDETKSSVEISSVRNIEERILDRTKKNHYIFELYRELPSPGVKYLSKRSRGALLRRFARPPDRRWVDARRYLALVEDMLVARLPLSRSLWTSAIYLAGRSRPSVTRQDLVRAIGIWNQMEHLAGIQSDNVVFTVLFDIAVKAGQFTVADRLIEEMDRRQLHFGREGKVAKIFYYGFKQDAESVGRAFDEFVESGEIVDTAVMNCVFSSLLKCGKRDLAEEIYYRLLQTQSNTEFAKMHLTSEFAVYRKSTRRLGRVLQMSASLKDSFPDHHAALQKALEIGPDTRTFHVVLTYHSRVTGNLNAIKHILKDMERFYAVPPRGMIYLLLFEGFALHGAQKLNRWNAAKLRKAWDTYLRALNESQTRIRRQSFALPPGFAWDNPLAGSDVTASSDSMDSQNPQGLPLPSSFPDMHDLLPGLGGTDTPKNGPEVNLTRVDSALESPQEQDSLEILENRLENGVFLGRRMIIIILRAFGGLCEPDEIIDVYLLMMDIWQPRKRRVLDVAAVREELEIQLNKAQRRVEVDWKK